jgi:hypothetical protein
LDDAVKHKFVEMASVKTVANGPQQDDHYEDDSIMIVDPATSEQDIKPTKNEAEADDGELSIESVMAVARTYGAYKIVLGDKTVRLRNPYSFFFKACQEARKSASPEIRTMKVNEFSVYASRIWHRMSAKEKSLFEKLAQGDKRRLQQEKLINGPPPKKRKARKKCKTIRRSSRITDKTRKAIKQEIKGQSAKNRTSEKSG